MCGIAGFAGKGTQDILEKMTRSLAYRGPDGEGYFFDEKFLVGLGHRRLSIIDLESGRQPIFNENKNITVILNGEIYNFLDLRKDLESRHKFITNSDTEVIVHLYEEIGEKVFEKLDGMFAIAIYDAPRNRLILARDRIGKKPLYWGVFDDAIIFGSEIKALMRHPSFKKDLDLESLNKYLSNDYAPTPGSIWKNIHKLEPATYLVWQKNKQILKNNFWKPNFNVSEISFNGAVAELDSLMDNSVRSRLVSDVPLGIFLSGGIDSSTIAYYAQKNSDSPIKTFSIAFDEKSFDESSYARKVAKFLGTEHFEESFRPKDMIDLVPEVAELLDEPLADPSILPTYLLSKFTKKNVTVALGGDGGDELFAGYPTFQADKLAGVYGLLPEIIKKSFKNIIDILPVSDSNFSLDFKLKTFAGGFGTNKKYRHAAWLGSFSHKDRSQLFRPEIWHTLENKNEYEETDRYLNEAKLAGWGNSVLYAYLRTYLMDQVLVKVDRASMFNSLEVRAPFLDYKLVDFVNSLPYNFKCRGWNTKYILKKLMADKLPREIVERSKKGFGVPVAKWLKSELRGLMEYYLSEEKIRNGDLFNYEYVKQIKDEHLAGRKDNRKLLWNLMAFQMWGEKWL
ncbi:MAG: asparagine synthase (glutamine-hydrolyzing) [Patescibacteria group bacterium]